MLRIRRFFPFALREFDRFKWKKQFKKLEEEAFIALILFLGKAKLPSDALYDDFFYELIEIRVSLPPIVDWSQLTPSTFEKLVNSLRHSHIEYYKNDHVHSEQKFCGVKIFTSTL